jgi:hypothetical protein
MCELAMLGSLMKDLICFYRKGKIEEAHRFSDTFLECHVRNHVGPTQTDQESAYSKYAETVTNKCDRTGLTGCLSGR